MTTQVERAFPRRAPPQASKWVRAGARIFTGLFAAQFALSGVLLLVGPQDVAATVHHLGYPDYFRRLLGFAKLLGVTALALPLPSPTPREWAYAGCTFTCIAASVSHAMSGDPIGKVVSPLVSLAILAASYVLRRRLAGGGSWRPETLGAGAHG
jgi:DoxX-like family